MLVAGEQAGETAELRLPHVGVDPGSGEHLVELSFRLRQPMPWAEQGYELAWGQIPLSPVAPVTRPSVLADSSIQLEIVGSKAVIISKQSTWTVDLAIGALSSWLKQGVELIAQPLEPSFFRAPTDNDSPQDGWDWRERRLVEDPGLERIIETAGDDDGLPRQEFDLADTASDVPIVGGRVVRASQYAHDPSSLVEIPEGNVSADARGRGHDTVLPPILTCALAVAAERDARNRSIFGAFVRFLRIRLLGTGSLLWRWLSCDLP